MYKISTKGFNTKDKLKIAKNYLIPDILKEFKLADIDFTDECLREIIAGYTENEEGVRNLKRQIETIIKQMIHTLVTQSIFFISLKNILK